MSVAWELVLVILALLVVAQAIAIMALARAVGLLYVRLGPAPGALSTGDGLALYAEVPAVTGFDLRTRRPVSFDVSGGRWGLLFVSPSCGTCRDLIRDAGRVDQQSGWGARLVVIARGTHDQNLLFSRMAPHLTILSDPLGDTATAFKVENTPFGMLVDDGRVIAKGIVNHRDHLESLLEAETSTAPDNWIRVAEASGTRVFTT